jgi:hypothetical protein
MPSSNGGTITFWDAELAHVFTGRYVASSQRLGLIAAAGHAGGAAVVILSTSPPHQVLIELPASQATQQIHAFEWSPQSTEEMLLIAWEDGAMAVISMSHPDRCVSATSTLSRVLCNGMSR